MNAPTLNHYKSKADDYNRSLLVKQHNEILGSNVVTCDCGRRSPYYLAFRCFHCGIWFCPECSAKHFLKTTPCNQ